MQLTLSATPEQIRVRKPRESYRLVGSEHMTTQHGTFRRLAVKLADGTELEGFIQIKTDSKSITVSTHFQDSSVPGSDIAWLVQQNERLTK